MEDLKIRVANKAESKETQELFFELGASLGNGDKHAVLVPNIMGFGVVDDLINFVFNDVAFSDIKQCKELTIPQLKDLVVLKRNCMDDATHEDYSGLKHLLLTHTRHVWGGNMWLISSADFSKLKPIQKEKIVKEYLVKDIDGKYWLAKDELSLVGIRKEDIIEVPEGAEILTFSSDEHVFWKDKGKYSFHTENSKYWDEANQEIANLSEYLSHFGDCVVWQREKESIIDKLVDDGVTDNTKAVQKIFKPSDFGVSDLPEFKHGVEATLAERQAQYGCFEDVAFVTENIMAVLSKVRTNGLNDLPHPHRMALYMIASKMARIVNGDFNHKDSWHDIGGYSKLIEDLI